MGVISPFSAIAHQMVSRGYCVIPISPPHADVKSPGKSPAVYRSGGKKWMHMSNWDTYFTRLPSEFEIENWSSFPHANIGLVLGGASNIVALDFDYDIQGMHAKIIDLIPDSPIKKKGAKGFTAFYRYTQNKYGSWSIEGKTVVEILSDGRQTVIPESLHPSGMQYVWLTEHNFLDCLPGDLPVIDDGLYDELNGLFKVNKDNPKVFVPTTDAQKNARRPYFGHQATSIEKIKEALTFCDPDPYKEWIDIGMALKEDMGDAGFYLWDEWSKQSTKYGDGKTNTVRKWDGFRGSGLGLPTVFWYAQERGFVNIPENLYDQITTSEKPSFNFTVGGKPLKNEPQIIEEEIQDHYQELKSNTEKHDLCFNAPGILGDIVKWITRSAPYPQPILALPAAISFMGTVKAHRIQSESGLRTNFYTMGVAESGSGKNHPIACIDKLLEICELSAHHGGTPGSAAGLFSSLVKAKGRQYLQLDEFGRILKTLTSSQSSHLFGITTLLMQLFSSSDKVFYGTEYANADGKRDRKDIIQPCLSVYATTVAKNLYESMTDSEAVDGFLSRWLIFESKDFQEERQAPSDSLMSPPDRIYEIVKYWDAQPRNAYPKGNLDESLNINPLIVKMSSEASVLAHAFELDMRRKMKEHLDKNTGLNAVYARTAEHAIKLALVAMDGNMVSGEDFDWASRVALWCTEYLCEAIEEHISANKTEAEVKKVLAIIGKNGMRGIPHRLLTRKTQFLKDRKRRAEILTDMIETAQIELIEHESKNHLERVYRLFKYNQPHTVETQ